MKFSHDGVPEDLPGSVLAYTPEQRQAVVAWLATLPLAELRERQAIKAVEQGRAFEMRGRLPARVAEEIDEQWKQLTDAVSLREFGVTMYS